MRIPEICYTTKFKIGMVIGLGVVVGTAIGGIVIKQIQKSQLAAYYASLEEDEEE